MYMCIAYLILFVENEADDLTINFY